MNVASINADWTQTKLSSLYYTKYKINQLKST